MEGGSLKIIFVKSEDNDANIPPKNRAKELIHKHDKKNEEKAIKDNIT
jgi:hypothetical protein